MSGDDDPGRHRRDVDEELELHLSMRVEALVRGGMDPEEARRRVEREAGDLDAARRYCARADASLARSRRRRDALAGWATEMKAGLRSLRRNPGSAGTAVGVLAAAIALNVVVFTVVRGVLLEPLPVPDAERVAVLSESRLGPGPGASGASYPAVRRWAEGSRSLEAVVAWLDWSPVFVRGDEASYLPGARVTPGFHDFVGQPPVLGRTLEPADHRADAEPVVVISRGLWEGAFAADPGVLGRVVELDGTGHRVVGVAGGDAWPEDAAVWTALEQGAPGLTEVWGARILSTLGRLRPGVSPDAAAAELDPLLSDIPDADEWQVAVVPLEEALLSDVRTPLLLLQGAVALVLLIASANVAILLLARGLARRGEVAVRKAMGAGGLRMTLSGVVEGLGLAGGAAVVGVGAAALLLEPALSLVPGELPRTGGLGIHAGVAAFALGLALLSGLAAGLVPGLQATRTDPGVALREGGSRHGGGPWVQRTRAGLVVGQVALSVVLLVVSGVMLRSFLATVGQDPGFRPEGILAADLSLPEARYPDPADWLAFVLDLRERLERRPEVEAAAVGRNLPLAGSTMISPVEVEGRGTTSEPVQIAWVTPDYFRVMGIEVADGRAFLPDDRAGSAPVALVDRVFAQRLLEPETDPLTLSARSFFGGGEARRVVGVVGSVRHGGLTEEPTPVFYEPFLQAPRGGFTLLVRAGPAAGGARALAPVVRETLRAMDPTLPVRSIATMEERIGRTVAAPRFYAVILGVFAALSLVLTVVGSYSVLSHLVAERRREIGIRMALGAAAGSVRALVLRRALALTAAGLVLGVGGGLLAARTLEGLLFGVSPADPAVLLALPAVMAAAAALAAWLPARRATRVDPVRTLQHG